MYGLKRLVKKYPHLTTVCLCCQFMNGKKTEARIMKMVLNIVSCCTE